jgi:hypothetical protein
MYLSVDVDYWNNGGDIEKYLKFLSKLNKPIHAFIQHQDILPHIHSLEENIITNIDYHSDLAEKFESFSFDPVDCGTWVNFVRNRQSGEYLWVYPESCCAAGSTNSDSAGRCNAVIDPFTYSSENCGWLNTEMKHRGLYHLDYDDVSAIGLVLSPDYANLYPRMAFWKFVKKNSIPVFNKAVSVGEIYNKIPKPVVIEKKLHKLYTKNTVSCFQKFPECFILK